MHGILGFMDRAQRVGQIFGRGMSYFGGPPANEVPVVDYGLGDLDEWNENDVQEKVAVGSAVMAASKISAGRIAASQSVLAAA
jgi:hypothetical protein